MSIFGVHFDRFLNLIEVKNENYNNHWQHSRDWIWPGKKLSETLIRNLEHIVPKDQVETLITDGYLNERMRSGSYRPSIQYLTEKYRRDEVYIPEAVSIISTFYSVLSGYSQD